LPNDIAQQDRLLRHHDLIKTRLGGRLILAPIQEHPQRILDLGTGIGLWAIEMGKSASLMDWNR
jgi:ubiquinone/menaquinone biosynthesis C-methylase UbiE